MVFDPYDLAIDVTPESTKEVLNNGEFAKALMLSFRLNEQDLILHVVENIPPQDSKYFVKSG
jgi:periodic tryptophan protein 2